MKRTKRPLRLVASLPLCVVLLIAGVLRSVHADGGAFGPHYERDVEMPAQKAIVVWDEERGHEDLILSVELLGGPEAAWVVPVPSLPEVKAASPLWFIRLYNRTKPVIEYQEITVYEEGRCVIIVTEEVEKETGVELISREQVGVYDLSILSADEPGALLDWLNDNGYAFPDAGGPILDAYVEEGGWYFVAARVLPGKSATLNADVQPLWFSFDTERPVYPMRLTSLMEGRLHVLIYVLAGHRMKITGQPFETEFAGELTLRGWPGDYDENELLSGRPYYITKLRRSVYAPEMTQDFYFERAPTDEPYREVIYRTRSVCPAATAPAPTQAEAETPPTRVASENEASQALTERSTDQRPGVSGWLVAGVGLALLGLLAGLGLVWRRSQGKPDNEQDA